jgi:hypothetical protein
MKTETKRSQKRIVLSREVRVTFAVRVVSKNERSSV